MKSIFLLIALALVTIAPFAFGEEALEEAVTCIASDSSSFILPIYFVASNGTYEEPGIQYQAYELSIFRPTFGMKHIEMNDLQKPIFTLMDEGEKTWKKDPAMSFELASHTESWGEVSLTRKRGHKRDPWKGTWKVSATEKLAVTCVHRSPY